MAETSQERTPVWLAFLAGAVTMLVIVLLWLAWNATRTAMSAALRADFLPQRTLRLPRMPPDRPHLPNPPFPTPR